MEEIIIAKGINKKINWDKQLLWDFLKNVNFTIYKGEFTTIVGDSGAGKSTLLRILLGYDREWEGDIFIKGVNIREMKEIELEKFRSENIGVCYKEKVPIIYTDNVKENICQRLQCYKDREVELEAEEILKTFNLTSIKYKKVLLCTPTELYRLMLALAFCGAPPIVIIDEVLDYFQPDERKELLETIMILQKKHEITMVMVSHEMDIIKEADRGLYIKDKTMYKLDMDKLRILVDRK